MRSLAEAPCPCSSLIISPPPQKGRSTGALTVTARRVPSGCCYREGLWISLWSRLCLYINPQLIHAADQQFLFLQKPHGLQ